MELCPLKALAELVGRRTGEYSGNARHDILHAIFSNTPQASRYSSQFGQRGGCRSEADARARRTACSFGSSTEIVSSASLHSLRSTSGKTAVVQGGLDLVGQKSREALELRNGPIDEDGGFVRHDQGRAG